MNENIRPDLFEEGGGSNSESDGNLLDHGDGRVAGTAFDVANVSAMDAGLVRKRFLAQPFLFAKAAQVSAEALADVHARLEARLSPIDLQTMSDIQVDCAGLSSMVLSLIVDKGAKMAQHVPTSTHSSTRNEVRG